VNAELAAAGIGIDFPPSARESVAELMARGSDVSAVPAQDDVATSGRRVGKARRTIGSRERLKAQMSARLLLRAIPPEDAERSDLRASHRPEVA
jgi:hypothetical protein